MPLQPIIVSTVDQALDGTTDDDLLDVIRKASNELDDILEMFDSKFIDELKEAITEQATKVILQNGELRDLASNQVRAE